jgi:threonine/homoserine/homoserine lactone efflux protein
MTNQRTIFILGLVVAIMPFLGFPSSWKKVFYILLGFGIAYLAYLLYKEKKASVSTKENRTNTYTDNRSESIR